MATKDTNKSTTKSTSTAKKSEAVKTDEQKTIEMLLAEVEALKKKIEESNAPVVVEDDSDKEEKMIRFISLARGSVMLRGSTKKPYEIEGRYSSRTFTETEARAIVNNMGSYMSEGYVYIDDAKFVKKVGLEQAYRSMINPDTLKTLFNLAPDSVVELYEEASEGQQRIILDMIQEKKGKGESVDANILIKIGKIAGMDLVTEEDSDE